jgi:putative membrane protein
MTRKFIDYLILVFKGMGMGAADVVPGVSGGTIAFISGIYEELIGSIKSISFNTLKLLKNKGIKAAWNSINGNFLAAVFTGIFISIFTLTRIIKYLLENEPVAVWSFFFGLILASVYFIGKQITKWTPQTIAGIVIGTVIAFYITTISSEAQIGNKAFFFISGMIAICAMILPGISGSFILLLLGSYYAVLNAVHDRDFLILGIFALGCLIGLLAFSRLLDFLFKRFKEVTLAVLTGFLIGSLNKIWPWKETIKFRTDSKGELVPFIQENVLPSSYNGNSMFLLAVSLMLVGIGLILVLESLPQFFEKNKK